MSCFDFTCTSSKFILNRLSSFRFIINFCVTIALNLNKYTVNSDFKIAELLFKLFMFRSITCRETAMPKTLSQIADFSDIDDAEIISGAISREQIDALNDVIYHQVVEVGSVRCLKMSLLIPRTEALKPAILYFPGGGFTSADYNKFIEMRMALAEAGFVVAAVEYRVIPDVFPAPLLDAKAAVQFLRDHAHCYGIDINRIGVLGDSAGGWLAQMIGLTAHVADFEPDTAPTQRSDVQAVVTLYGISNLLNIGEGFSEAVKNVHRSPAVTEALLVHGVAFDKFAGASIMQDKNKALYASPIGHIGTSYPPFLIMHGRNDSLVSPIQSVQLFNALKNNGDVKLIIVEEAEHGDLIWFQPWVIHRVVEWFKDKLVK